MLCRLMEGSSSSNVDPCAVVRCLTIGRRQLRVPISSSSLPCGPPPCGSHLRSDDCTPCHAKSVAQLLPALGLCKSVTCLHLTLNLAPLPWRPGGCPNHLTMPTISGAAAAACSLKPPQHYSNATGLWPVCRFLFFLHLAVLLQRCSCLLPGQVLQVGQGVVKLAAVIHQDVQVPLWLVGCMGHIEGMVVVACCSAHLHMEVRLDISSLSRAN